MLFRKKENLIKHYLNTKAELRTWKPDHVTLLEGLLLQEIDVPDEDFLVRGSMLFAAVSDWIKNNGDLLDVIRAISDTRIQNRS
ncbi:hypothetical protein M8998_03915 [Sphingobacterium sp. lm-10]|uniref:hypothetical protein n=1 Tax=Sphingobacterium sp. lm-10 TaxID=2944904 RepID=UPI002021FD19|nr:hypothetical protein [Sphingobacterium sp. lm-10]MCL7987085.1 hypothetical protein [Sphingobacterium sp. lm-10]